MKDAANASHRAIERNRIAQVAFDALDGQSFKQPQIAVLSDQNPNGMSCGDKLPGDVASHEPGGTRDKGGHKMRKTSFSCAATGVAGLDVRLPVP